MSKIKKTSAISLIDRLIYHRIWMVEDYSEAARQNHATLVSQCESELEDRCATAGISKNLDGDSYSIPPFVGNFDELQERIDLLKYFTTYRKQ